MVPAASPAALDLLLDVGPTGVPGRAEVEVSVETPAAMPWLDLLAGPGGAPFMPAAGSVAAGLLPPSIGGARRLDVAGLAPADRQALLSERERFDLGCDPVQIGFHASAELEASEAHVLRIRQRVEGNLVGGYTVVLCKR